MRNIRSILAATDFSPDALRAARRAADLARALGASLHVLHVVDATRLAELRSLIPDGADAERRVVEEARRLTGELAAGLPTDCEQRVEVGTLPGAILEASLAHDLLVLGAHGAQPFREALLGSTASRLLLKSQRPILVVKREPEGPYRSVVVPCEYAPPARRALELALAIAPEARITLLHATEVEFETRLWRAAVPAERLEALRAAATERARSWLVGLARDLPGAERVSPVVIHGPARGLVPEMTKGADLVVMGKQGRSAAGEMFLGSVTRRVLAEAACDVLVEPASRDPS